MAFENTRSKSTLNLLKSGGVALLLIAILVFAALNTIVDDLTASKIVILSPTPAPLVLPITDFTTMKNTSSTSPLPHENRYITFCPQGGFTNYLFQLASAARFAVAARRTLVVPPFNDVHIGDSIVDTPALVKQMTPRALAITYSQFMQNWQNKTDANKIRLTKDGCIAVTASAVASTAADLAARAAKSTVKARRHTAALPSATTQPQCLPQVNVKRFRFRTYCNAVSHPFVLRLSVYTNLTIIVHCTTEQNVEQNKTLKMTSVPMCTFRLQMC
jgi:hypothetical protein